MYNINMVHTAQIFEQKGEHMKRLSRKIAAMAAAAVSMGAMSITTIAEYLPGQVKPPTDFFTFSDETGKYLCYRNAFGTYTIGSEVDSYTLYPQIDWYDGDWHYSEEWDNANTYERKYNIIGDKVSDIAGCLRITHNKGASFNGESALPNKIRVRYVTELKAKGSDELTVEISEWSEEIMLSELKDVDLDNCTIPAPSIHSISRIGAGNYKIGIEGTEGFYMLYGLPNYRLVMYIEAKTSGSDWTNIMSTMVFSPMEDITIAIPEGIGLNVDEEPALRCKYGIEYNGETIYSEWSNVGNSSTLVEDADFVSNGDVEFIPSERVFEETRNEQLIEETPKEQSKDKISIKKIIIEIAAGTVAAIAAIAGLNAYQKKRKK